MNTHAEPTSDSKQPAAKSQASDRKASENTDLLSFDQSIEAATHSNIQAKINNSAHSVQLKELENVINSSAHVKKQNEWQAIADQSMNVSDSQGTVQRAVHDSATYPPNQGAAAIANLNGQIAASEAEASARVQNQGIYAGVPHSAIQANYILHPSAMTWGSCVEEILNPLAAVAGWNLNNNAHGANPDYRQDINGAIVWADLTTEGESGPGGPHITDKLLTMRGQGAPNVGQWEAADVTHAGTNPLGGGPPGNPVYNGNITQAHLLAHQAYRAYQKIEDEEADWDPDKDEVEQTYGNVSHAAYTRDWSEEQRDEFTQAVNDAGF